MYLRILQCFMWLVLQKRINCKYQNMKQHLLSITFLSLSAFSACKKNSIDTNPMQETSAQTMAGTTTVSALNRLTFDWKTVPVGADIGDATRDFSADEISF